MKLFKLISVLFCLFAVDFAFAAAGTGSNLSSLFDQIQSQMTIVSLSVVTIAVIWAGYKVLFMGVQLQQVAGPLIGAILIAAAPWIASLIVG